MSSQQLLEATYHCGVEEDRGTHKKLYLYNSTKLTHDINLKVRFYEPERLGISNSAVTVVNNDPIQLCQILTIVDNEKQNKLYSQTKRVNIYLI